jgi:OTU domain-containing protein 6
LNLSGAPSTQPRKQNRQKARLARRAAERDALAHQAAEEATNLPDLKQREREIMLEQFRRQDLKEKEVRADGHCLYAAVADGLECQGLELSPIMASATGNQDQTIEDFRIVRQTAAKYIEDHADVFIPFLEEPLVDYVSKVRDTGEWGGQVELLAIAKAYNVDISVLQSDGEPVDIEGDGPADSRKKLFLAYYKHNFGLGEHYNSLRKQP